MKINKKELNLFKETTKKIDLLNASFDEIKKQDKFISFDKLISTVLLKSTTSFKNKEINKLLDLLKTAFLNKQEIIFDKFIISFKLDKELNNFYLVPYITDKPATNFEAINLKTNSSLIKENITLYLNDEINNLLANNFYIEIFENIIVKSDNQNNLLNIFYNEKNILGW